MIYIVLVNFKGARDTIACVTSINAQIDAPARVIVVENGSEDGSLELLEDWARSAVNDAGYRGEGEWSNLRPAAGRDIRVPVAFKIIASGENLGFAGGCNIGIGLAMDDPVCTHVWLLNNDTVLEDDALAPLITRLAECPRMGMVGSTLVYYDNPDLVQACGGRFNPLTGRGKPLGEHMLLPLELDRQAVEDELDYAVGASMLVKRDFVARVGLMSERYFLYFEELDWAVRGAKHGFRLGWAPGSIVYHKEGASIGTNTRARPSNLSVYFMTASYLRFLFQHRKMLIPVGLALSLLKSSKWLLRRDTAAASRVMRAIAAVIRSPRHSLPKLELPEAK